MQKNTSKNRFITGFTGLRALAVIGVILYHLNSTLFSGGYLGVPIFLTLSGYLVTDHLIHEYTETNGFDYRNFWNKRFKKLYPTLIVMLFVTAAYITVFQRNLIANLWQSIITNLTYTYNWYEIFNGQSYFQNFAGSESPFTHLWTLAVEGQFYLIWPLIMIFLLKLFNRNGSHFGSRKVNTKPILFVALALSALSIFLMAVIFKPKVDPSRVYYGTDTRMFSILFGAALATVWPSNKLGSNSKLSAVFFDLLGLVGLAAMVAMVFVMHSQSAFLYRGGMALFSAANVLIIWAILAKQSHWNRLLTNPVFDWIGSRSYGIYVFQLPVFVFFGDKFKNLADNQLLYSVIEIIIIAIISEISYRTIEKPFGSFDYSPIINSIKSLFSRFKLTYFVLALTLILGLFGTIQSTLVSPHAANHTQLAKRIKKSATKEKQHNKELAEKIKNHEEIKAVPADAKRFEKEGLTPEQLNKAVNLSGSAIGDSVMLSSRDDLQKIFPRLYIDASVARQTKDGAQSIQSLAQQGLLGNNVIIGLGTNGTVDKDNIKQIMNIVGPSRTVFWINNHVPSQPWQNTNNAALTEATKKYPNLKIIDWNKYISSHTNWLYTDETHPNQIGSLKYSSFIAKDVLSNK
ncbi:acyltransferase family protein [Fructilactobacillus sp. Tb1]|uniref:acyltransferase family protein n=1 Tax=Fructilactobacillus sp. Tb1 TaxID=3422304 RepID=UPI003D2741FB